MELPTHPKTKPTAMSGNRFASAPKLISRIDWTWPESTGRNRQWKLQKSSEKPYYKESETIVISLQDRRRELLSGQHLASVYRHEPARP